MDKTYQVAGYVKLANLWKRTKNEIEHYHRQYYQEKYINLNDMELVDVYIDITGQREIIKRPEMIRLIRDCKNGLVNCIVVQTKAYLAATTLDFFYLLHYLFNLPTQVEIITEDYDYYINTILNPENQRSELINLANKYISLNIDRYVEWEKQINEAVLAE